MYRFSLPCLAAPLVLLACGDKGGDATTIDATTTNATTTDATSTTDGGTAATTEAPPTTSAAECEPPMGEPLGPAVKLEIVNMRDTPVYLDGTLGCYPVPGYKIVPAGSDTPLVITADCQFGCAEVLAGQDCGCDLGCAADQARRIDPGVTMQASWSGGQIVPVTLADGCGAESCGGRCIVLGPVPAGAYNLVVPASSTVDCFDVCTCPPDEPACLVAGARGPDDLTVELAWNYPDQTQLLIVFE